VLSVLSEGGSSGSKPLVKNQRWASTGRDLQNGKEEGWLSSSVCNHQVSTCNRHHRGRAGKKRGVKRAWESGYISKIVGGLY